jgi:hypothetical protein
LKDTIFGHVGRRSFLFVMSVDEATPEDSVLADSSQALA